MVKNWQILLVDTLAIGTVLIYPTQKALAQITTDGTVGTPTNLTGPNYDIPQSLGQTVKNSLFHSFGEFNLNSNEAAIFHSGNEINNIFSRVTGGSSSSINGLIRTLGQDVNLFFLNPNGIIFGPNASLDVSGSFLATTADSFIFGNGLEFSATNPKEAPLLTVNFTPGLQYGQNHFTRTIENQGNLTTGQNLELSAGSLDLRGQLQAGQDLTLQADKIQIRDSLTNPFIATAGNKLLIQGNQSIDIFALNHPNSGLFSGGDLTLSSANPVIGDVHFWSGGNFQIKKLDGSLGNLYSPYDSVIRASGDVSFDSYTGASLHIFAGGSVTISGDINITATDTVENSIQERVTLSDGETVVDIDGSTEPTLDIRAGTTGFGQPSSITGSTDSFSNLTNTEVIATSADINVQSITNNGGLVFLTNQNQPDSDLSGEITVGSIDTSSDFGGGNVFIDSRDGITVNSLINVSGGDINTFNFLSDGGDINLFANRDITIVPNAAIASFGLLGGNIAFKSKTAISATSSSIENLSVVDTLDSSTLTGGDINIQGLSLSLSDDALVGNFTSGVANAGDINIQVTEKIRLTRGGRINAISFADGNAGSISIDARSLDLTEGGRIESVTFADGNAGSISINAQSVTITGNAPISGRSSGLFSSVGLFGGSGRQGGAGNGGNIIIQTDSLRVLNGGRISADIFGTDTAAKAGSINIKANSVEVIGFNADNNFLSGIFAAVTPLSRGSAGDVTVETETLRLMDGGFISASTFGEGNAGSVKVKAKSIEVVGVAPSPSDVPSRLRTNVDVSSDFPSSTGDGGNLIIETETLRVANGGQILANTEGEGQAGNVSITAQSSVLLSDNSKLTVETSSAGKPGDIIITTPDLTIGKDAEISATATETSTNTEGGGSITVNASNLDLTGKLGIFAETQGIAPAGTLNLQPDNNKPNLDIQFTDTAIISASTTASGTGGDINLTAPETINITGQGKVAVETTGTGDAGSINITTQNFNISKQTEISASTFSSGKAGDINITANNFNLIEDATVITNTAGSGQAGDIQLQIKDNLNLVNSTIAASTAPNSTGKGGNININPQIDTQTIIIQDGAAIAVNSDGSGEGGSISLAAEELTLNNGSITAETVSNQGGNITLNVGDILQFIDDGEITASAGTAQAGGDGGNVNINADFIIAFPTDNIYDITANAFQGDGGDIDLRTISFFGSDFVNISASSEFGLAGDVSIAILELDPAKGLIQLPANLIDASQQISQACTPEAGEPDRFVVTGRGGLPLSPNEPLRGTAVVTDWVDEPIAATSKEHSVKTTVAESSAEIVEAQGWVINDRGNVELVSQPATNSVVPLPIPCSK
ncbi:filamentous hemagglutinin N-terminal domain-containing protein [Pleurocapsales cyanobacterium LEGE 10410]|nr:filamentous hemagglutinin N-terminal domain-containing protein [Pleurocapsales cyanobacterium LEGE 10410]